MINFAYLKYRISMEFINYREDIDKLFKKYTHISNTSICDNFFLTKYGRYGIYTRKDWLICKENFDIYELTYDLKYIEKLFKEKGATYINANLKSIKPRGSRGPSTPGSGGERPIQHNEWERYDVENLYTFNYKEWLNSGRNKYKKIYNIIFNHEFYDDKGIEYYKRFKEIYHEWLRNGNIDKFNEFVEKLDNYLTVNKLKTKEDYFEGSVICNIALIISKYIKTGILEDNIDFILKMDLDEMNEETNMFCLFLMLQLFTAKEYSYVQYIRGFRRPKYIIDKETGEKIEIPWKIIHNIRRRSTDRDYKTKGVIPMFIQNEDGTYSFILY